MPRLRPLACAVVLTIAPFVATNVQASSTDLLLDTVDTTVPVTEPSYVYDLEKEPSECIGFLPKPGCGKKPEQAGDRGGALQYLVFGIMLSGLTVIGTVLVRNVIKRDRAMNEEMKNTGA